jgi:hypothetical protein
MNDVDPVVKIIAGLDRPVNPRVEFKDALHTRILGELHAAAELRSSRGRPWRVYVLPRTRWRHGRRRRVVALAAALLLVAFGTAAAIGGVRAVREFLFQPFYPPSDVRTTRVVAGVRFSFILHQSFPPPHHLAWENGPIEHVGRKSNGAPISHTHGLLINRSLVGGQAGEAVVFWTAFPEGGEATPCDNLLRQPVGGSTSALAAAMAMAPGIKVVQRPRRVIVGGRPATNVVLRVRSDRGCDPGYFFKWPDQHWGAFWPGTSTGDTIRVWIVDVAGKRLVIQAETKPIPCPCDISGYPQIDFKQTEKDITKLIESIRFE